MSRTRVVALAVLLGADMAPGSATASSEPLLTEYFNIHREGWLAGFEDTFTVAYAPVVAKASAVTIPTDIVKPLAVIYDDVQLEPSSTRELDTLPGGGMWKLDTGNPLAWTLDSQAADKLMLYPTPEVSGNTIGGSTPFTAWVPGNLTVIGLGEANGANLGSTPSELWQALELLAREYSYDTGQRDLGLAKLLRVFSAELRGLMAPTISTNVFDG